MGSINLRDVGVTANVPLFSNLNFVVGSGERLGLVAGNGGGKTSLLRCIAGLAEPSSGEIVRSRGLRVGYVEQDVPEGLLGLTLLQALRQALPADERESESWRADVTLDDFATPAAMRDRLIADLSGGWQRLMLLGRVWVNQPDALLLDEPTNHLDLAKLFMLEKWINSAARDIPVIIASHDRDFLDACTNRTLVLRAGLSRYFSLPYSDARRALDEEDSAAAVKLDRDLKEARQLRRQASKLTNIGINSGSDLLTVKAKYLKGRASRIEEAARPVHKDRSGEIRLSNSGTHAKVLLAFEDVPVTTPAGELLFRTGKLHVFQGERIVLLGANGAGKSQFVRLVRRAIGGDAVAGINVTPSVVLGFVDQQMSQLPSSSTPEDVVGGYRVGDARARALLAAAGFPPEKQIRPITELSYGQRARLGLLALRLQQPNFYLMDEPTNHVDIAGREALEQEIMAQEATAILVSHDRTFVRHIGTRYLLIEGRRLNAADGPEGFFEAMRRVD